MLKAGEMQPDASVDAGSSSSISVSVHHHQQGQAVDQMLSNKMMLPAAAAQADDDIESVGQKCVHYPSYSRAYASDPDLALLNNTCR